MCAYSRAAGEGAPISVSPPHLQLTRIPAPPRAGGDPTGTGTGGESIYGQPFPCELHSRLRFNRRGLLAMANTGHDDNTSQFFLTLDRAEALQGKHTIFGKVVGDTIFNLLQIGELEVEEGEGEGDRPLFPARILGAEVLMNPFEDMVPREKRAAALVWTVLSLVLLPLLLLLLPLHDTMARTTTSTTATDRCRNPRQAQVRAPPHPGSASGRT